MSPGDDPLARIMARLDEIGEDTRLTALALHGGRDRDGRHVTGLLDECAELTKRVEALELEAAQRGKRLWAVLLALLTTVLGWIAAQVGSSGHPGSPQS